jgi:DME family drug/metabolite transporter
MTSSSRVEGTRAERRRGQGLVLGAAILWGTTGTAQALAPQGAQPAVVGAVRLAIGGAALLALARARGGFYSGTRWPLVATTLASGSMAAYQLFFFAGVALTGVAVGTVVTIGSSPVLAGTLALLARGERPSTRWAPATLLAVVGCSLLLTSGGSTAIDVGGILLALSAGLSYAVYAVSSKALLERKRPDAAMAAVFCLGALLLSPLLVTGDLNWLVQPQGMAAALHLGLIATAAAYVLFARGLSVTPVATAVTLSLAEPLTAAFLGIVLLGERLTLVPMLGIGLLLSGLALLALGPQPGRADG